jgi:lipoprotein-releasing system permease protein
MTAFRYLRARKSEGFVSVIAGFSFAGILLGVATLIIVMAVMNGFRTELFNRIIGLNGHMTVYGSGQPVADYKARARELQAIKDVKKVIPQVENQALLSTGNAATGVLVRGLSREAFKRKPILTDSLVSGTLANFAAQRVIIGTEMARRLGVTVGEQITLTAPEGKSTPFGTIPRTGRFRIAGIFDVGMYEYNNGYLFMPLKAAQTFFQMPGNSVSALQLFAKDARNLGPVKKQVRHKLPAPLGVYDWREANDSFFNALKVERNVMFLILTLIILVAAFNIISSMIMLVKDKTRDIAIMRTMGATRGAMLRIFMLTGVTIGVVGTAVGATFGIAFASNIETIRNLLENLTGTELFADEIYFLSRLPAEINWDEVAAVIAMAITLSVLATLYPAWRAARMDPVEALRNE